VFDDFTFRVTHSKHSIPVVPVPEDGKLSSAPEANDTTSSRAPPPKSAASIADAVLSATAIAGTTASGERPRRHLIIGDIHGCIDEFKHLLSKCGLPDMTNAKARATCPIDWTVVHVGDLVGKGPASREVVQYCIDIGAIGVMGNHDNQVLVCAKELGLLPPIADDKKTIPATHIPPYPGVGFYASGIETEHSKIAKQLSKQQLQYLVCPLARIRICA
jgi:hypothetical protein